MCGLLFLLILMLLAAGAFSVVVEHIQAQYLKATRIERQRDQFKQVQESIRKQGIASRENLLSKSQQADLEELSSIVKEQLEKFSIDIPPRLFQDARESIDKYVEAMEFDKVYTLYEILGSARKNTIFQELNRFFRWGYMK